MEDRRVGRRRRRGPMNAAFRRQQRQGRCKQITTIVLSSYVCAGTFVGEKKSLDKIFSQARKSGKLKVCGRSLTEVPKEVFALDEQKNLGSDEKWWECVELTSIDFSNNSLTELPEEIGTLLGLTKIVLSYNKIQELPLGLGKLEMLSSLKIDHNKLRTIDAGIFIRGSRIAELWLHHNEIVTVPDSIFMMEHLQNLQLSNNMLKSLPESIKLCRYLASINLTKNSLRSLPTGFCNLQSLTNLEIACNSLVVLPDLSHTKLTRLDASRNLIENLPTLPLSIMELHLNDNRLREVAGVVKLKKLSVLNIADNSISNLSPDLKVLQNLKFLDVSNNNLAMLPGELGLIDSLNLLSISGNALRAFKKSLIGADTDQMKKYLRTRISSDMDEYVQDSKFKDKRTLLRTAASGSLSLRKQNLQYIPAEVLEIQNLHTLDASENQLTKLPDGFLSKNNTLRIVMLDHNRFVEIPAPLAKMNKLVELHLRKNMLASFPIKHTLSNLQHIDLRNNRLSVFPTGLISMKNLRWCFLGFNEITRLPNLRSMISLDTLDVSNNKLALIEDGLRFLPNLQNLNLENNSLRSIPLEVGVCSGLKSLQVSGNPFRMLKHRVIQHGTQAIIEFVRKKIPLNSDLLKGEQNFPAETDQSDGATSGVHEYKIKTMKQEISILAHELESVNVSNAKRYALKKKIALKRANLIRLERKKRQGVS